MDTEAVDQVRIMDLSRDPEEGFWRARLSLDGEAVHVDRSCGSWLIPGEEDRPALRCRRSRQLHPGVAAKLQQRVRSEERKEKEDE